MKSVPPIHLALVPFSPTPLLEALAISSLPDPQFPPRAEPPMCETKFVRLVVVDSAPMIRSAKQIVALAMQEFALQLLGLLQRIWRSVATTLQVQLYHAAAVVSVLSVARRAQRILAKPACAIWVCGDPHGHAQLRRTLIMVVLRWTRFSASTRLGVVKHATSIHLVLALSSPTLLSEGIATSSLLDTVFATQAGPLFCEMEWFAALVAVGNVIVMHSAKDSVGLAMPESALLRLVQRQTVERWPQVQPRRAVVVAVQESGISRNGCP